MTISSTSRKAGPFQGNDAATSFPFTFKVFKKEDVRVTITNLAGSDSDLVLDSDYSITLNSDQDAAPGGTVVYPISGVPLRVGYRLTITGALVNTQPTDIQNTGGFYPQVLEDMSDRSTIQIQQLAEDLSRSLKFSVSDPGTNPTLPPADIRANKVLGFDAAGIPTVLLPASGDASEVALALASFINSLANDTDPDQGAALVGYPPGTNVFEALQAAEADIGNLQNDVTQLEGDVSRLDALTAATVRQNLDPVAIDMHFGTLRGVGWGSSEVAGQVVNVTATVASAAGSIALAVSNGAQLKVDQLICYVSTNAQYYPAVIKAISGNNLTLKDPLEAPVAVGGQVYNFYANDAHPNQYGYNTLVDDALRRLGYREQLVNVKRDYQAWTAVASGSVAADTSFSYENPGISEVANRSVRVTAPGVGDGAKSPPVALPGGTYRFSVAVNFGQRVGGFSSGVLLNVIETTSSGETYGVFTETLTGFNGIRLMQGVFTVRPGSTVNITITTVMTGGVTFNIGRLSYFRILGRLGSLNRGKHVLFGDSWFASGLMMQRFQQRLPNATFVNKGVSGNKITDLVARFTTDVVPEQPDFVWVMCGTNDIYAGITAAAFEAELNTLKTNFAAIGAQPIFFNCSVGSAFYPIAPGEQLTNSRRYAIRVNYLNQTVQLGGPGSDVRTFPISATVTVPAGSSVVVGSTPEPTSSTATLRNLISVSGGALTLRIGYATTIDTTLTDQKSFASGTLQADVLLNRTNSDRRIVNVVASNGGGSPLTITVSAEISWAKD